MSISKTLIDFPTRHSAGINSRSGSGNNINQAYLRCSHSNPAEEPGPSPHFRRKCEAASLWRVKLSQFTFLKHARYQKSYTFRKDVDKSQLQGILNAINSYFKHKLRNLTVHNELPLHSKESTGTNYQDSMLLFKFSLFSYPNVCFHHFNYVYIRIYD